MKKIYIIKFKGTENPRYLYDIDFCNLLGQGVAYDAICTSSRVLAMRFQKKYVAEALAKLTRGEVEVVGDDDEIRLAEAHFAAFDGGEALE